MMQTARPPVNRWPLAREGDEAPRADGCQTVNFGSARRGRLRGCILPAGATAHHDRAEPDLAMYGEVRRLQREIKDADGADPGTGSMGATDRGAAPEVELALRLRELARLQGRV